MLIWTDPPEDFIEEAIDFLTHGPAHHVGFLRANGRIHEMYPPKLRDRDVLESEKKNIRVFSLAGLPPELELKFERLFDLNLPAALEYSNADLLRYLTNSEVPMDGSFFCSFYVMHCISQCAPMCMPLTRCEQWQVSPRDLFISTRLIEESWPTPQ